MALDLTGPRGAMERLLMTDHCVITRPSTERKILDRESGQFANSPPPIQIYSGPCQVSYVNAGSRFAEGGGLKQFGQYWLSIPVGAGEPTEPLDDVLIDAVDEKNDPELVGQTFRLDDQAFSTVALSKRLRMTRAAAVPQP